ncbi:MAG TPA: hydantoinase B/oxoprolinase family protein [bacterium]|nr:hydantoinase B/oxoprolinase family protein [bacterium]
MPDVDPVALQIQWSRLVTIMDEVDAALVRTAFSTILGETRDFAVIMLDGRARSVAQSQLSSPAFTCSLPFATRHMLKMFPIDSLAPGDVLMTNDPWLTHGHLPDFILAQPLFASGRVAAFVASAAHISDIGGRLDEFEARDVYEEGLRIPPSKLMIGGRANEQLFRLIEANVRVPRLVLGDVHAILGAFQTGAERFAEFAADYGAEAFQALCDQILVRSEAAMRDAIRALPEGRYTGEATADGYRDPVEIRVVLHVRDGSIRADFTGSSSESATASVNCVLNVTFAHTIFPLKCSLTPDVPNNEGLFRPIAVHAPEGSVLNARFPAPVKARSKSSYHIHNAIYAALAPALPGHVQAGSGSFWSVRCMSRDADGAPVITHVLPNGGKGAASGTDGLSTIAFPGNGTITPAEIIENSAPLVVARRALRPDSGGAGAARGGLGQEIVFRVRGAVPVQMSVRPDKVRFPAPGLLGGLPGARGELLLDARPLDPGPFALTPGHVLVMRLPGGGGLGAPGQRERSRVAADVREGYVTPDAAERLYGWTPSIPSSRAVRIVPRRTAPAKRRVGSTSTNRRAAARVARTMKEGKR